MEFHNLILSRALKGYNLNYISKVKGLIKARVEGAVWWGAAAEHSCEYLGIESRLWMVGNWEDGVRVSPGFVQGVSHYKRQCMNSSVLPFLHNKPSCAEIDLNDTGDIQCLPHIYL